MADRAKRLSLKQLSPVIGIAVFAGAVWILSRQLQEVRPSEFASALHAVPPLRLAASLALVFASYFSATLYDALALRSMGRRFPLWQSTLASFISNSFSNTVGFGLLTGGSLRLRMYSTWDLSVGEVSRILLFQTISVWLGFLSLSGIVFMVQPADVPGAVQLPFGSLRLIGVVCLAPVLTYAFLTLVRRKPVRLFRLEVPLPGPRHVGPQLFVAAADWLLGAAAMFTLIGPVTGLPFETFLGIHFLALVAAMASQVPGGLGVLETVYVLSLSGTTPAATVLATLLVFRALFHLVPLALGMLLLFGFEIVRLRGLGGGRLQLFVKRLVPAAGPPMVSLIVLINGAAILISSALNLPGAGLELLGAVTAPGIVETSRLAAAAVGALLVVLARALQQRIDAAYYATIALTAAGALLSVVGRTGLFELALSLFLLVSIIPMRKQFYRRSSILTFRPGGRWGLMSAIGAGLALWLAVLFSASIPGPSSSWLAWVLSPAGPTALRAIFLGLTVGALATIAGLLRPDGDSTAVVQPSPERIARAAASHGPVRQTRSQERMQAGFSALASRGGNALLQYIRSGRSWISLDGPLGTADEWAELLWHYRSRADRYGYKALVVAELDDGRDVLQEAGFATAIIGRRAGADLSTYRAPAAGDDAHRLALCSVAEGAEAIREIQFSRSRAKGRRAGGRRGGEAAGRRPREAAKAEILGAGADPSLRAVALLEDGERSIAAALLLCLPEASYLSVERCHVVRSDGRELLQELFHNVCRWARAEGYRTVDFGLFPPAPMAKSMGQMWWNRIGRSLYRHGGHFREIAGFRRFENALAPSYSPVYIGTRRELAVPGSLTEVSALAERHTI